MKTKKVKIKRLYKGFASVRSYVVQKCIDEKESIQIICGEDKMTISWEDLHKFRQLNKRLFESMYANMRYTLCDYYFKADKK
jgi:hypothetical protein